MGNNSLPKVFCYFSKKKKPTYPFSPTDTWLPSLFRPLSKTQLGHASSSRAYGYLRADLSKCWWGWYGLVTDWYGLLCREFGGSMIYLEAYWYWRDGFKANGQ